MKQYTSVSDFIEDVYHVKIMLTSISHCGIKWETVDGRVLLLNRKDYLWAIEKIHD